jgi:repressor LexA
MEGVLLMLNLYKNIKERRIELKMSQDTLAELTGYRDRSSIAKIEKGEVDISESKIREFAKALKVSPRKLMGWDEHTTQSELLSQDKKGVVINVLGRVAAGIPLEAITDIIDTEEISQNLAKTGEFFGLQIHGDSMEPRMYEGDIVIVRQQDDAESGDIVIAMVNGNDATCKRLMKYAGGISLISLNSKYQPMQYTNQEIEETPVRIIGKVVELRGKF